MPHIKYTINVTYQDNSYGKQVIKTQPFSGRDIPEVLNKIEKWRYDNGYVIKSSLDNANFVSEKAED